MVGIILKFTGTIKNTIKMLLQKLDMGEKVIDLQHWESDGDRACRYDLNKFEKLSPDIIKKELIIEDNEIYPEFAELFVRDALNPKLEISTYGSFVNSTYDISIIIIDYRNIEICSKTEAYLLQIIENFKNCSLLNKKIKTLENIDSSACLRAWRSHDEAGIGDSALNR